MLTFTRFSNLIRKAPLQTLFPYRAAHSLSHLFLVCIVHDPQHLISTIDYLKDLHSKETLERWKALAQDGQWTTLVTELLEQHYDALYRRSQNSNYVNYEKATSYNTADLTAKGIDILAKQILMGHHHV
jgi:tRNA 2-selenouridine synthase